MKLPSLSFLKEQSVSAFTRFPLTLLNALTGTIIAIIIINYDGLYRGQYLGRIGLATILGISFITTIVLVAEKRNWSSTAKILLQIGGLILLAGYCFSLPPNLNAAPQSHWIRFSMLLAGVHLLSAAAPFIGKGEINGFWQYNKILFIRILTAILFSSVLFGGLAIALQALEHLFSIDINHRRYEELYVVIMGIFNTWFFLGGVPDLHTIREETDYPKGLKIFTQYILIPLVIVYVLILYAYAGKIVFTWEWPEGWVSKLILGFSITGILSLLLVHPIKDLAENKWIRTVSKWFYTVLIPLDVMLLLAITLRISDYGITEPRYIVLVLGLWLTGITLYFVLSKSKNIKVIPSSLCVIAFLASFGPWGAFQVSENNQISRLKSYLMKNQVLVNNKITKNHSEVPFDDTKEISSIIRYLNENHGYDGIQQWFDIPLDTLGSANADTLYDSHRYQRPQLLASIMGIKYIDQWQTAENVYFNFASTRSAAVNLEGYVYLISFENFGAPETIRTVNIGTADCVLRYNHKQLTVSVTTALQNDSLTFDIIPLINGLVERYGNKSYDMSIPPDSMMISLRNELLQGQLWLRNIQCRKSEQTTNASVISGELLIGYNAATK